MRHKVFCLSLLIAAFGPAPPLEAERIVVFGDSWGVPFAPALQQVLNDNGHSSVTVLNAAFGGETASQMSSNSLTRGLPYITDVLTTNSDANLVHLSIGGNDLLGSWNPAFTPSQEDALHQAIYDDITTVANHILSIRPDIQIYHPTYDYLPATTFDPLRFNPVLDSGSVFAQTLADSLPRMTFHNSLGLMQVNYGFSSLGIPPFDPSLPDPTRGSPSIAFADAIHLTADGYSIFAQEAFDVFYKSQAVPEPSSFALFSMGAIGVLDHRRRKRKQAA